MPTNAALPQIDYAANLQALNLRREIGYWTTLGNVARMNLRNAENCRAHAIQKYISASSDAEQERWFQEAGKQSERVAEHLRTIAESETMIAEITAQTIAMTAPVSVRLAAE